MKTDIESKIDYQKLFDHLKDKHDVTLLENDMQEIKDIVDNETRLSILGAIGEGWRDAWEASLTGLEKMIKLNFEENNDRPEYLSALKTVILFIHTKLYEDPERVALRVKKEPTIGTAMREMFDQLHGYSYLIPTGLIEKCEELMTREKEQIIEAHIRGQENEKDYWNIGDKSMTRHSGNGIKYYKETYNPDQV